jgi:HEAT repeat protein
MLTPAARKYSTTVMVLASWVACLLCLTIASSISAQSLETLTPSQLEINKQRQRFNSSSDEDRRDALMRLGSMHLAEASRAALPGLTDPSAMVRVTAAKAILSLSPSESVQVLIPLLGDKDEFVRRETSYALGLTRSKNATAALVERLLQDKEDGVRGAAAVALGQIADESAVVSLSTVLTGQAKRKGKQERNEFVLRATAEALGKIRSLAGAPALIAAVTNEKLSSDIRREAARALGVIGDPGAVPALMQAAMSSDPYLSVAAYDALKKISR